MSSHDNIDDLFRSRLGKSASGDIPEDFLADINEKLDALEKKKKKRGILFWLIPGLLVAGGVTYGLMAGMQATNPTPDIGQQASDTKDQIQDAQREDSRITKVEPAKTSETEQVGQGTQANPIVFGQNAPDQNPAEKSSNTNNNVHRTYADRILNHTAQKSNSGQNNGNDRQDGPGKEQEGKETEEKTAGELPTTRNPDQHEAATQDTVLQLAQQAPNEQGKQDTTGNVETEQPSTQQNPPLAAGKKAGLGGFSLSVLGGAQYVINTLPGYTDNEYFSKRLSEEKEIIGAEASVMLNKQFGQWSVASGLNYSEWGEKIRYAPVKYKTEVVVVDTTGGDTTTYVIENEALNTMVTEHNNRINKYRYIGIPFMAGYRFSLGNKMALTPRIGGMAGLLLGNNRGYYISRHLTYVTTDMANSIVFNVQGSVELSYRLGKVNLLFSPYYRRNVNLLVGRKPGTFNSEGTETRNRYEAFGLHFGIGFDL